MAEPLGWQARGRLMFHEPMARHVSWRAGGRAARVCAPADLSDLQALLRALPRQERIYFVGLGSNLLVRDGGYRGTVILLHDTRGDMHFDGEQLYAAAGVASPKVARFAATHGFEGAEFLAGVPGTVGGALAMNAGCYGAETWEVVARVRTVTRSGELRERSARDFEVGYRHVALRDAELGTQEWFVGAWFGFRRGDGERSRRRMRELLEKRVATQPLNKPNAGSVFRNPPGDHAARLIEACGLKSFAIGGARVSEKHANFIVNADRAATAAHIEALIIHVQSVVHDRFGVVLVPEVRLIGEPA